MNNDYTITAVFTQIPPANTIVITIIGSSEAVTGDELDIIIIGLTPFGPFTKTVCVNGDCTSYNLTADSSGDFEGTLILYTSGTATVTVIDQTTGAEAAVSFDVAQAPPVGGSGTAIAEAADNPGNHPVLIPSEFLLGWNIVDSIITINGILGVSELTGTLGADGTFIATSEGTYDGFPTTFILDGYVTPEGIFGVLTVGNEGGLPGGLAIIYYMLLLFM